MKYLSYLISLFKAVEPAGLEEIALHIDRLNELLLAYRQVRAMAATEWQATESEIEKELQWFAIHHLKLTSTSYPIQLTTVQPTGAIGLKRQLAHPCN
jgi:hypothetical protein